MRSQVSAPRDYPGVREQTDEELADRAPHDGDAFVLLYRRYEVPVLAYFRRRTTTDAAVDLTAETFAAALGAIKRGNGPDGRFGSWLLSIAHHKHVDALRRGRVQDEARRKLGLQRLEVTDEDLERVDELLDLDVAKIVAELPEDQRMALLARIVDERSYEEIAQDLACSPFVVRKRVSRGLAALRQQFAGGQTS